MKCFVAGEGKKEKLKHNDALIHTTSSGEIASPRKQHVFEGRVVYEWDQTATQARIYVKVPEGITRHELDIKIGSRRLHIGRVGKPPFMREETYDAILEESSGWRLRSNGELQIHLQKERKGEWPCVLLDHPSPESDDA